MSDSLRVAIRFRPVNKRESEEPGNKVCVKTAMGRAARIYRESLPAQTFSFDQVYAPGVAQADVYAYTGKPLVEQVINGFNSTIFAYGQTGSGKTYSMMGVPNNADHEGMIPRICKDIFTELEADESGDQFEIYVSMLQIYLERVADLFNPMNDNMILQEHKGGRVAAKGATRTRCYSPAEVMDCIDLGISNRATSATSMNAESSRSHMVVVLELVRTKKSGGKVTSCCKMVDLAGSEKTGKTNATGDRLREAQAINKSLSQLGTVMKALTDAKSKFIPYRGSKLTQLLKDSLGGNSKTSLLCATSPCSFNVDETLSTLRFAALAKKVKTKAVIMEDKTIEEYQRDEKKLKAENERLTKKLTLSEATLKAFREWVEENENARTLETILNAVVINDPNAEAELDTSGLAFEDCSSQMVVLNKETGLVEAGGLFSTKLTMLGAQEEQKEGGAVSAAEFKQQNGLSPEAGVIGGVDPEEVRELREDLLDSQCELNGRNMEVSLLQEELSTAREDFNRANAAALKFEQEIAEARFFKQKAAFLEQDVLTMLRQVRAETRMFESQMEELEDTNQLLALDASNPDAFRAQATHQIMKLRRSLKKKDQLLHKSMQFKEQAQVNMQKFDKLAPTKQRAMLAKALSNVNAAKLMMTAGKEKITKTQRALKQSLQKEVYQKQLRANWQKQMDGMQKAVVIAKNVHQRDASVSTAEIASLKNKVAKMEQRLVQLAQPRSSSPSARHQPAALGAAPARRHANRRGRANRRAKPRRASRDLTQEIQQAA